ncbi:MAG: GntR family transcriptional regulator [Lachnospiraceae bacterium]|nr:GntR family transcriptional regulator [Lachnospiraceae bacterium]
MILIDYKDRRPIYEQVIEKFQQIILCGILAPGDAMPSVRSLAMELSINPNTIQRAYQELERSGYIYSVKGKGSFVSDTGIAAELKRSEQQKELNAYVSKVLATGVTEQELAVMLEVAVENAKKEGTK